MRTKWKNFLSAIIAISMIATTLSPVGFAADMNYAAEETASKEATAEESVVEEQQVEQTTTLQLFLPKRIPHIHIIKRNILI